MKRRIVTFLVGMAFGMALLSSGSALASTVLTAVPSNHVFYVDGRQVSLTAYEIGGNNYLRLRDIGQAVGFNVYWDGTVQIESDKPYTGISPTSQASIPIQQNPIIPTEDSVSAVLQSLEVRYPNNTLYPTPYRSTSNGPYSSGMNCAGWATLCSDAAFGTLPWRRISTPNWAQIRIGDLVQYNNEFGSHVVVVTEKTNEYIIATESTTTQKAYWGAQYFRWWLEKQSGLILYTRYPE